MSSPDSYTLFEVSWEVCNKVGGIHTVISTKARTLVDHLGDDYVTVGPWLLSQSGRELPFQDVEGYGDFIQACREMDIPVRVGRWQIPGRPLTILVEFSRLFEKKNEILAELWEDYKVDSIRGGWEYVEPVLFGYAAGMVIEKWFVEYGLGGGLVAQFHEWMTGSGLLYLKTNVPEAGTVFTSHATILGRSIASTGVLPEEGVGPKPEKKAIEMGVPAKHSMEGTAAAEADVFTTVSEITASEAVAVHGRSADIILPNGIDLNVIDSLAGEEGRDAVRARLQELARKFLGKSVSDSALMCISGRYEFHNKGIDLLLTALSEMNGQPGPGAVLFVLVPAGTSGPRPELLERLSRDEADDTPLGVSTHILFNPDQDPVTVQCREVGLNNQADSRIHVIQIPIYLNGEDGFLNLPYEAVLRAMDLSCFPSFYEPWGYTPEESLALGVPTVTTDLAGFGAWAEGMGFSSEAGISVLKRKGIPEAEAGAALVELLEGLLASPRVTAETCRRTASAASWEDLIEHYHGAFAQALNASAARMEGVPRRARRFLVPLEAGPASPRPRVFPVEVAPTIPDALADLEELSKNLWWTWDREAQSLFADLDPELWDTGGHNPQTLLAQVSPAVFEERAQDEAYRHRVRSVGERFRRYLEEGADLRPADTAVQAAHPVAYFSAEFGIHESLPIYSGGLGVLAGDHIKAASDSGLPLVAVSLFYGKGYFSQLLTQELDQLMVDVKNDPRFLPFDPVLNDSGQPLEVTLEFPGTLVTLRAWKTQVGRVPLYLLDADLPANQAEDRAITHKLYGGNQENRLRQEIVLGRGGVKLLSALGIEPSVYHLNEGHAAFVSLERTAGHLRQGLTFAEAQEMIRSTTVFTTHTPVPAGHDKFGEDLIRRYFSDVPGWAGISWDRFLELGRNQDEPDLFNMTYFACRFSSVVNGVSVKHAEVTRGLLRSLWPVCLESEVPVRSVTNGIHLPTWTDARVAGLLGAEGRPVSSEDFRAVESVPAEKLWEVRCALRSEVREALRRRVEASFIRHGHSSGLFTPMLSALQDERALLIGFARRFVTYKRPDLLLRDPARLARILGDSERPVRLVFAGKAHPADGLGQELLRRLLEMASSEEFAGKILFLEDYGMSLSRLLVRGVDVWLNNPIPPMEASGTSGMKAAANGVLNLSTADGWWLEAPPVGSGWTIGDSEPINPEIRDEIDSNHLYHLLETEIVPEFFDRDAQDVPGAWVERIRRNLATIPPLFNTERMVADYRKLAYEPLASNFGALSQGTIRARVEESRRLIQGFGEVAIEAVRISDLTGARVGSPVTAEVEIQTGSLTPDDLCVELVLGKARNGDDLLDPAATPLTPAPGGAAGRVLFRGKAVLNESGSLGYGVRVRLRARDTGSTQDCPVLWAGGA